MNPPIQQTFYHFEAMLTEYLVDEWMLYACRSEVFTMYCAGESVEWTAGYVRERV